ncbi:hypothetical protein N9A94_03260 [Akkermansiaceae bacterium]|nr:hypothetical protein [Akkermansiaceae bacterium]MDB4544721.1 hypothetical protein [Akkermansiaceae bacterium]
MFEFTIFRIPVRVEPWFWVVGFFLGHGLSIQNQQDLLGTLLWMIVVFVSILIHELGHAMTSRKLTKVQPNIRLWSMGGLAYPNTSLSRKESFWVTLAGPLAGIGFFLLISLICILQYGGTTGLGMMKWLVSSHLGLEPEARNAFREMHWATFEILYSLVFINFWWSLVNLLPVHPLDGGQIYATIELSQRKVYQVGFVTGVATAILGWVLFQNWWVSLMFGYLAYQNYQKLQHSQTPWR